MVWNQETSQKPAEDTVQGIRGNLRMQDNVKPMRIDRDRLLMSFHIFDSQYKRLLGEYIKTDADLKALVYNTAAIADKLKPLNCDSSWADDVKLQLPHIIAGIFAVFTVLKSGASYNRLESNKSATDMGEKLLMKPHNIQVLTLLCMFGCGSP